MASSLSVMPGLDPGIHAFDPGGSPGRPEAVRPGMTTPTSVDVVTFGCRLNAYESEAVARLAADAGLTDAVIINTCAVTAEAERQARQAIRRLKRERPGTSIIVTGCAAQIDPATFAAMPEVARVVGNADKLHAATWRDVDGAPAVQVSDIMRVRKMAPHLLPAFAEHTRAFVEVQ